MVLKWFEKGLVDVFLTWFLTQASIILHLQTSVNAPKSGLVTNEIRSTLNCLRMSSPNGGNQWLVYLPAPDHLGPM